VLRTCGEGLVILYDSLGSFWIAQQLTAVLSVSKRGLQLVPLALLLLHDQGCKIRCHGGHRTS
jgi:hypothetical protein